MSIDFCSKKIFGKQLHKLPIVKYLRKILGVYVILPLRPRLRPRPASFLARKQKLIELCTNFNSLHLDILGRDLVPFMIEIMYL